MRPLTLIFLFATVGVAWLAWGEAQGPVPTTIEDFFLPGSQPGESGTIQSIDKCDNCHQDSNNDVEVAFEWSGSMMAHALRDPLFLATMAIAEQDAPGSGDMCIRCHTPRGWLEGRSTPTDGTALNAGDRESIDCDFCHRAMKPSPVGVNPYPGDPDYTANTYPIEQSYLATIDSIPMHSANGMYVVSDDNNAKWGPFNDAQATHPVVYSPYHSESAMCGTCHDVSNPVFARDSGPKYDPTPFGERAPDFNPHAMFPVERTFSEWANSEYNSPGGVFAPQFGGNKTNVSTCQDCHMRDVSGVACNKNDAVFRDDLPLHDLTGGNTFVPEIIKTHFAGEVNATALDSGIVRARRMLQLAATMTMGYSVEGTGIEVEVEVTNDTGHKLPSGYPEGRRIWLNLRAYDELDQLIYESGAYDTATAVLTHDADAKVYEIKPGISYRLAPIVSLPAGPSFHFVLNDTIWFDNRIPPRGFTNAAFEAIQSPPVGYSYEDGAYSDQTDYLVPFTARTVVATLYYQTTSKEYVEFLRDNNMSNTWGQTMYDLWASHGKSTPEAMVRDTLIIPPVVAVGEETALGLRLSGPNPNPTRQSVLVRFTLPTAAPATLELLDARGRILTSRRVGALGPGTHQVDLSEGVPLASGVYFARLVQSGKEVRTKIVYQR